MFYQSTGYMLREQRVRCLKMRLDQSITKFLSGPLGGDQQVGARIAEGKIDVLIFLGYHGSHSHMILM